MVSLKNIQVYLLPLCVLLTIILHTTEAGTFFLNAHFKYEIFSSPKREGFILDIAVQYRMFSGNKDCVKMSILKKKIIYIVIIIF